MDCLAWAGLKFPLARDTTDLPLMLANAWKPVDIYLLVEMLSLTIAPFPRFVCQSLLRAIAQEPGVGGRAWEAALLEIENAYRERLRLKVID